MDDYSDQKDLSFDPYSGSLRGIPVGNFKCSLCLKASTSSHHHPYCSESCKNAHQTHKWKRIVVSGGRTYTNQARLNHVLKLLKPTRIATGHSMGADLLAQFYATKANIPYSAYPADWNQYGRAAGPIRNKNMLEDFKPEVVIAFPGGIGTQDCIRAAKKANIPVYEVPE